MVSFFWSFPGQTTTPWPALFSFFLYKFYISRRIHQMSNNAHAHLKQDSIHRFLVHTCTVASGELQMYLNKQFLSNSWISSLSSWIYKTVVILHLSHPAPAVEVEPPACWAVIEKRNWKVGQHAMWKQWRRLLDGRGSRESLLRLLSNERTALR